MNQPKAIIAQEDGAVGLVVVNNEPGGHMFAMPGHSDDEDGVLSSVNIPVIMVRSAALLWLLRRAVREPEHAGFPG